MHNVIQELADTLYNGQNPYATAQPRFLDGNYPHTNIRPLLVEALLLQMQPAFWLELGSFVGGSAIKTAQAIKKVLPTTRMVCVDPFCGDVNMWAWEKDTPIAGRDGTPYRFVGLLDGKPTVYDRFLANVFYNGHSDVVLPLACTATVGLKLIQRLHAEGRLSALPSVIYLDSAHELNETYLELLLSWALLPEGGVLFGDDWNWPAVRHDVQRVAREVKFNEQAAQRVQQSLPGAVVDNGIMLYDGQWALFK